MVRIVSFLPFFAGFTGLVLGRPEPAPQITPAPPTSPLPPIPAPTYTPPGCTWNACWIYTDKCSAEQTYCTLHPKCGGPNNPTFPTDSCGPPPRTSTPPPYPTSSPSPTSSCYTICADYVNECGMMYGGCFPDPKCTGGTAWPTFPKPPCPSSTGPTNPSCGIKCVDAVNECGMKYGGCYDSCKGPFPYTPPPCPPTSKTKKPPKPTKSPKPPKSCRPHSKPKCQSTSVTSSKCDVSICIDYIDACGQGYGGCTLAEFCGGPATPSFSTPYCSITRTPAAAQAVATRTSGE